MTDDAGRRTQEQRRAETERRVVDAATELIATSGSRRITLAQVGEAAGYSRGIVYHQFGSRERLVEGNATLKRDGLIEEVTRLRAEPGGSISVGGPTLAAGLIEAGMIDEFRPVIHPVVLGGGKPFLPSLDTPIKLKLLESRRFASGATYLRYARAD